jgi:hypothetical protein
MKRPMVCAPRTVPFAIRVALVSLVALGGSSCSGSRTSVASPDPGGPSASAEPTSSGAPLERSREGAFATRRHRNLFAEIGKPAADIDAKIADAYQRLFHGSPDQVVRFDAGRNERGPLAIVLDVGNDDVRSEGNALHAVAPARQRQFSHPDAVIGLMRRAAAAVRLRL